MSSICCHSFVQLPLAVAVRLTIFERNSAKTKGKASLNKTPSGNSFYDDPSLA